MKTLSCFSYKGGAGRSTLAMNVTPYLAKKLGASPERPLILVDMDIDSCGLTFLFNLQDSKDIDEFSTQRLFGFNGSIPGMDAKDEITDHIFFRHLCPIGRYYNMEDKAVLCIPALPGGMLGDVRSNYDGVSNALKDFLDLCDDYDCSGILFDSAVGNQLTAQWSNRNSDTILCCMRPTQQFREGTLRFFESFDRFYRNKEIIVIPNVVPDNNYDIEEENEEGEKVVRHYPDYARQRISSGFKKLKENGKNTYRLDLIEDETLGVPRIDRFMWREGILYTLKEKDKLETEAARKYEMIADIVCED